MSEPDVIAIRGASEHNLKSISLDVPKKALVVFSGVSGSGESSLAFDTLYAEGQRRYVESLSAYARQFLGQMGKRKGEHRDVLSEAQKRGFARARMDGRVRGLEEPITLDKKTKHSIEVVVDRLVLKPELRSRLTDSVETALREGKGVLMLTDESGGNPRVMSELNACH